MTVRSLVIGLLGLAMFTSAASAQQDNALQRVKDRGTLRVCTAAYAPWNVKNPTNNEWEGIVPDIVKGIAEALKVKLEWVDSSWATVIAGVQSDKCDLIGAALWTAPQRAEVVSFTRPIGGDGMSIFIPSDSKVKSIAELDVKGKVIAVAAGSGDERVARSLFKNAEVKSVVADRSNPAVMELAAGRADAASAALLGTSQMLKNNSQVRVKPIEGLQYAFTPFAFATAPKEYFFRDYVSTLIGNFEASGRLKEIQDQWTKVER